ncbi:hypothetical protein DAPPUDRAFT_244275 [Daphnia pulex]|uniref:Uncharacterized protein n=1 Tax=Daphnia pulex TaxID=6669 RepID=E9GKL0_DAPPU|nr:hypothetical protein DAPPUDRAFT_244275 [Daphnia pulex]|eukprot:EFX80044.1 hypothetical protein DAPPUDRAFT_244275 [Daphnia pulex]
MGENKEGTGYSLRLSTVSHFRVPEIQTDMVIIIVPDTPRKYKVVGKFASVSDCRAGKGRSDTQPNARCYRQCLQARRHDFNCEETIKHFFLQAALFFYFPVGFNSSHGLTDSYELNVLPTDIRIAILNNMPRYGVRGYAAYKDVVAGLQTKYETMKLNSENYFRICLKRNKLDEVDNVANDLFLHCKSGLVQLY